MVAKKVEPEEEVLVAEPNEGKSVYRVSFSLDPSLRRKIRIAAALHDMDQGEWMSRIIERAAEKALEEART